MMLGHSHAESRSRACVPKLVLLALVAAGLVVVTINGVVEKGNALGQGDVIKSSKVQRVERVYDDSRIKTDITGGVVVSPNTIPFIASLQTLDGGHFCTGSILSVRSILTAAHCFDDGKTASQIRVVLGEHKVSESDANREQIRGVLEIIKHENYLGSINDVCVLTLSNVLVLNSVVQVANLASQGAQAPAQGTSVIAAGWGTLRMGDKKGSDVLRSVELKVQSDTQCKNLGWWDSFREHMICATDPGQGACSGDSGGPLFLADETKLVVGIAAFVGDECGGSGGSVYEEVSYFRDWINSKIVTDTPTWCVGQVLEGKAFVGMAYEENAPAVATLTDCQVMCASDLQCECYIVVKQGNLNFCQKQTQCNAHMIGDIPGVTGLKSGMCKSE